MPAGGLTAIALGIVMQVGYPGPSETPNYPPLRDANQHYGFEGQYEQRYPFDSQQNWVHGYFQEIPAYGGHAFYRPYNYKDVLSQSQTAAGWGMSPTMPYSQQFWHRYHDQATMLKLSRTSSPAPLTPQPPSAVVPAGSWGPMQSAMPPAVRPSVPTASTPNAVQWIGPATMPVAPVQSAPWGAAIAPQSGPILTVPQ
jgi:hypothetical protein